MKRLLALLLAALLMANMCVLVLAEGVAPLLEEEEEYTYTPPTAASDGHAFDGEEMYFVKGVEKVPHAIETWVYLPADWDTSVRPGTLFSSYAGATNAPYFHFDLYSKDGKIIPRIEWKDVYDNTQATYAISFPEIVVKPGEWVHIAFSYDPAVGMAVGFMNGALVSTPSTVVKPTYEDFDDRAMDYPVVVGGDMRPGLEQSFKGSIHSMTLYDGQRTEGEVASAYASGPVLSDTRMMAHWDLPAADGSVSDKSTATPALNLEHNVVWCDAPNITDSAYSFAFLPDIQYLIENDAAFGTTQVKEMCDWIADQINAKNIKYVMGLGDVTEYDIPLQWSTAYNAISGSLGGKIPYSIVNGNHDYGSVGGTAKTYDPTTGEIITQTKYGAGTGLNLTFGSDPIYTAEFSGDKGGTFAAGDYRNTYKLMTIGETDWLFIHLDWDPSDAVLEWAGDLAEAHSTRRVLVTTHNYMHGDGRVTDPERTSSKIVNNTGIDIWNKFVSLYENIEIVVSGHQEYNCVTMTQSKGVHGNTVSQFLIDMQMIDATLMGGRKTSNVGGYGADKEGLGIVALFHFSADGKNVQVETYSVLKEKYYMSCNQLSFATDADKNETNATWGGRIEAPLGSGTANDPYLIKNGGNLAWMASQVKEAGYASLNGVHFKQVCDIDLDGSAIKSIGYYHTSVGGSLSMAAFGGHYDGGGFSIKNGRIVSYNQNFNTNINWCGGLFGAIYGATVENVTLDNVTVYSRGVTGGIVGRALAPADGTAGADFNSIINCHVKSNCRINAWLPVGKTLSLSGDTRHEFYDNRYNYGIVGSICGMAYATTIDGCTSAVTLVADANRTVMGGIVGTAGYNSVVSCCAFTGSIELADGTTLNDGKTGTPIPFTAGGIVGLISPNALTNTMYDKDNFKGALTVQHCYNSGSFSFTGSGTIARELHLGGIIGEAKCLYDGFTYAVEDCYNLAALAAPTAATGATFVAGIVGKAVTTAAAEQGYLAVNDCASVAVSAVGGAGSNEYRMTDTVNAAGKAPVVANANVTTKSETDMAADMARIKNRIDDKQIKGFVIGGVFNTLYTTLGEAVSAASAGDVIYMLGNVTMANSEGSVTVSKALTINGRGGTLTLEYTGGQYTFIVNSSGNLTLTSFELIRSATQGVVTLTGGKVTLRSLTCQGDGAAVIYVNATASTELIMDNAVVENTSIANSSKAVIYWKNGATSVITLKNGSMIRRNSQAYSNGVQSVVENYVIRTANTAGKYTLNLESGSRVVANYAKGSEKRSGGFLWYEGNKTTSTFNVNAEEGCYFVMDATSDVLSLCCPFYRKNPPSDFNLPHNAVLLASNNYSTLINQGDGYHILSLKPIEKVTLDGKSYFAHDFVPRVIDNGSYYIFGQSLIDTAAAAGRVVTLEGDVFTDGSLTLAAGKKLVIDLNGHTLYQTSVDSYTFTGISGDLTIRNGNIVVWGGFDVLKGGKLTLDNVTATVRPGALRGYSRPIVRLVGSDAAYNGTDEATLVVNNSTLETKSNGEVLIVVYKGIHGIINLTGNTTLRNKAYIKSGAAAQNLSVISMQHTDAQGYAHATINVGANVSLIMAPTTDADSTTSIPSVISDYTKGDVTVNLASGALLSIERDGTKASNTYFVREQRAEGTTTVNDSGATFKANKQAIKDGVYLPKLADVANKIRLGFANGSTLLTHKAIYKTTVGGTVTFVPVLVDATAFDMVDGATLRTVSGSNGIRFTTAVDPALLELLAQYNVSAAFGTVIAPGTDADDDPLQHASALTVAKENQFHTAFSKNGVDYDNVYHAAITMGANTPREAMYRLSLAARGYMTLTYANGTDTVYTAFDANNVTSMLKVAEAMYAEDPTGTAALNVAMDILTVCNSTVLGQ